MDYTTELRKISDAYLKAKKAGDELAMIELQGAAQAVMNARVMNLKN